MKTVITTVGLSLFTNYLKQSDDIEDNFNDLNTLEMTADKWDENKSDIDSIKKSLLSNNDKLDSAEIKSLIKLSNNYKQTPLNVYLIATDTILSKLAAEIIKEILEEKYSDWKFQTIKVINNLNIYSNSLKDIHLGYHELIGYLNKITYEGVFYNISGGYKAIIPIMTLIASLKKANLCYIYEDSNKLIEIPPFPFELDINECKQFKDLFENIEENTFISIDEYESYKKGFITDIRKNIILKSFIVKDNEKNEVYFSEIGHILWDEWKNQQPVELIETNLDPNQKKISLRDDHGKDELNEFAKKLINSPYVIEVINSIPYNPKETSFIRNITNDGKIELVLHKTDRGLGLIVQTTGRNLRETRKIAENLEKKYYA